MNEIMPKIDVLDHGFVRRVDHMGGDLSVVRAARVSYDAEWRSGENKGSDTKLIQYLMRNNHTSPFEAVVMTFEVKAPIFVLRQWHRHRTWSYNELSARYRELPEEYYVPKPEHIGVQSKDSKQARDIITDGDMLCREPYKDESKNMQADIMRTAMKQVYTVYQSLLDLEVPRELARSVLPFSMYSHMFATVNLHNLFKFCSLRLHEHAQYEIRVYAEAMLTLATETAPVSCEGFRERLKKKQGYE